MTRIEDLFVDKPIKKQPVETRVEIGGSFSCQNCDAESESAYMEDGKIWWVCSECNFRSVVNGFG